jgi:energy-coupling factor transport system permease protein
MIRGMEYVKGDSWLHRLDPRTKLTFFLFLNTTMIVIRDPIWAALLVILVYMSLVLCGVDRRSLHAFLKGMVPMYILYFLFNLYLHPISREAASDPRNILFYTIPFADWAPVTAQAIVYSTAVLLRFLLVLVSIRAVTLVTPLVDIVTSLVKWRLPPKIALALSLGVGSIPVFISSINAITDAQKSRGWAGLESGSVLERVKALLPLVIPVVMRTWRVGENIAVAIESRGFGYDIEHRTWRVEPKFGVDDVVAFGLMVSLLIGLVIIHHLGWTEWTFTYGLLQSRL